MNRLEANREIVEIIAAWVEANPDWRFGQLMRNAGVINDNRLSDHGVTVWVNEFHIESADLLKRLRANSPPTVNQVEPVLIQSPDQWLAELDKYTAKGMVNFTAEALRIAIKQRDVALKSSVEAMEALVENQKVMKHNYKQQLILARLERDNIITNINLMVARFKADPSNQANPRLVMTSIGLDYEASDTMIDEALAIVRGQI